MSKESYIESAGENCPVCGEANVESTGGFEVGFTGALQSCACNNCGSTWTDVYILSDIRDLTLIDA